MLKRKHVLLHTDATPEQAAELLRAATTPGSPDADDMVGMLKDTVTSHAQPFRGEVVGPTFKVTRKARGRRVRIGMEGTLKEGAGGGTEIRASMAAPLSMKVGLVGGVLAALGISASMVAMGGDPVIPALLALVQLPAVLIASRLYERETSASFGALRDALPAHVPAPVAPVSQSDAAQPIAAPPVKG